MKVILLALFAKKYLGKYISQIHHRKYTPLCEKGKKETQNKPMETTKYLDLLFDVARFVVCEQTHTTFL